VLAPILLPSIGLYEFMYEINLIGSIYGIALAQCCVLYPYMLKPIEGLLTTEGFKSEVVARHFGASKSETFLKVTMPRIMRPLSQGAFFVFVGSFNDYIISFLLGDFKIKTLSVILYPLMQSDNRATSAMVIAIYTIPLVILYFVVTKTFKWRTHVKDI
jgi:putative spermidine/putrescine transport system permease protein